MLFKGIMNRYESRNSCLKVTVSVRNCLLFSVVGFSFTCILHHVLCWGLEDVMSLKCLNYFFADVIFCLSASISGGIVRRLSNYKIFHHITYPIHELLLLLLLLLLL